MEGNNARNICGMIVAVLLSVLLFTVLLVMPFAATVQSLTVPDNLSDLIKAIDFTALVKENEGFQQQVEEMGIPADAINQVMHSDIVEDITELYENDLNAALENADTETQFTKQAVMQIFLDNTQEIAAFAKQYVPNAAYISEQALEKQVEITIKERGGAVVNFLPPAKELAQTVIAANDPDGSLAALQKAVTFVRETLMVILYAAFGVLTVLLLAVRWRGWRCCLWAGVTFAGGGLVTALSALGISGLFSLLSSALPATVTDFLTPLGNVFSNGLFPFAVIFGSMGVIFLVTFIVAARLSDKAVKTAE